MHERDLETAKTLALVAVILNFVGFLLSLITIFLAILPFIWLLLDYLLVYKPLTERDPSSAETPSLVLGIIQLLLLDILSGILLIITYVKIKDATRP